MGDEHGKWKCCTDRIRYENMLPPSRETADFHLPYLEESEEEGRPIRAATREICRKSSEDILMTLFSVFVKKTVVVPPTPSFSL